MSLPLSQSDAKFIERIRRLVQFWDRWRHFVTIGGLAVIGWSIWYLHTTWQVVTNVDAGHPFMLAEINKTWMLIALFFGLGLGMNFAGLLSCMVNSILGGYRAERMLLKLYSELYSAQDNTDAG